ncbi:MAG: FeoC-like transcriptional regulator [Gammaproteobacteria bacterium]
MNLLEIKNYLMRVKMASLTSLTAYFNCDSQLLQQMLSHWVRKGCVRKCVAKPACGTQCLQCKVPATEVYEWVFSL